MVFSRVFVVKGSVDFLKKAVTIATRYSAVRRQSELYPGEPEAQIISYKTQQEKLFVPLAKVFGFHFSAEMLLEAYHMAQDLMVEIDDQESLAKADAIAAELHQLSCGLKALVTAEVTESVDLLRRSCGGHGYMACSNFPRLFGLATAAMTYEGENTVLQLQVCNSTIK